MMVQIPICLINFKCLTAELCKGLVEWAYCGNSISQLGFPGNPAQTPAPNGITSRQWQRPSHVGLFVCTIGGSGDALSIFMLMVESKCCVTKYQYLKDRTQKNPPLLCDSKLCYWLNNKETISKPSFLS